MKRDPTEEEFEKIGAAIFAGDRVEAVSHYMSITECGLTKAQDCVNRLTAELTASNPEKFARKKPRKAGWTRQ
jgi:ribosomal protein L7/L12